MVAAALTGTGGTTILLAHDPRRLVEAAALDVQLVLSGHTHGGQVVLPGLGAVAAQSRELRRGGGAVGLDEADVADVGYFATQDREIQIRQVEVVGIVGWIERRRLHGRL